MCLCHPENPTQFRSIYRNQKVGGQEATLSHKRLGEEWAKVPDHERMRFLDMANELQSRRDDLKVRPLDKNHSVQEEAAQANLSTSQVHRLNHARLNVTLSQVAEHPGWSKGLGLSDHVSALRPQFLENDLREEDMNKFLAAYFGYDSKVYANGAIPSFSRSCMWSNSGVCQTDRYFGMVSLLLPQLDQMLQDNGMIGSGPKLITFSGESQDIGPSSWILGCVCRKPISHIGVAVHSIRPGAFQITVKDGVPRVSTMHQAVGAFLRRSSQCGMDADTINIQARCSPYQLPQNINIAWRVIVVQ